MPLDFCVTVKFLYLFDFNKNIKIKTVVVVVNQLTLVWSIAALPSLDVECKELTIRQHFFILNHLRKFCPTFHKLHFLNFIKMIFFNIYFISLAI